MASTFKNFLNSDISTTRTMLHEKVPITGSIMARTYGSAATSETNIKTFNHAMFTSVYDYPYLSSSSNHLMDITFGTHPDWDGYQADTTGKGYPDDFTTAAGIQQFKLRSNIYQQMQQTLVYRDQKSNLRKFDRDGNFSDTTDDMYHNCVFISMSRLLVKDEIKKGTFKMEFGVGQHALSADYTDSVPGNADGAVRDAIFEPANNKGGTVVIEDTGAADAFRVNSPVGEYAILYAKETDGPDADTNPDTTALEGDNPSVKVGLIYYQAGIVVMNMDWLADYEIVNSGNQNGPDDDGYLTNRGDGVTALDYLNWYWDSSLQTPAALSWYNMLKGPSTIDHLSEGLRHRINKIEFNNTTELNSTIYFCRVNQNEYNYSSNPSYLTAGSKIVVKENTTDNPVTYITSVGLYSGDNELMAVAKLSEPLKKDPNNSLSLRVRLDY